MSAIARPLTQIALMACFITVTSNDLEGRMIVAFDAISTIESINADCRHGTAIHLKTGRKICVLDSLDKIHQALSALKNCQN